MYPLAERASSAALSGGKDRLLGSNHTIERARVCALPLMLSLCPQSKACVCSGWLSVCALVSLKRILTSNGFVCMVPCLIKKSSFFSCTRSNHVPLLGDCRAQE